MKKIVIETGVLAPNVNLLTENYYKIKRHKKKMIYNAFQDYIEFLEHESDYEDDNYQIYLMKKEVKKLKKEQKRYYIPKIINKPKRKSKN